MELDDERIRSRRDYKAFLAADLAARHDAVWRPWHRFTRPVIHFQRMMRRIEYLQNCRRDPLSRLLLVLLRLRFHRLSVRLGFSIPPGVFGPGLSIAHHGTIVVNAKTRVGRNCRIHCDVNIGDLRGKTPRIGNNVYIGPGAKIFGDIDIGDDVAIGANAVVNRSVPSNVTVGGVPAKVISQEGSQGLVVDGCARAGLPPPPPRA